MSENTVTSKQVIHRLVERYDCSGNTWMCNSFFAGGECDFMYYTRTSYLHEIEVKISRSDWMADRYKKKWSNPDREKVSYFWYCVPEKLANNIPEWVDERFGILAFRVLENWMGKYIAIAEVRKAKKLDGSKKLTDRDKLYIIGKTWHRYADQIRIDVIGGRYFGRHSDGIQCEEGGVHSPGSSGER